MKRLLNLLNEYFESVPDRLRKRGLLVWIFFIAASIFMSVGVTRTEFDMTIEGWFEEDDPAKLALDNFRAEFGSDDGVFIVYKPKDGDVFSKKSLQAVQGLREELLNFRMRLNEGETSTLEHVTRIDTLVNASILKSEDDSLVSGKLVGRTVPEAPEELEAIRRTAVAQKSFPLLYFSKNYQYGGIRIETDFGAILKEAPSGTDAFESEDEVEGEGEFTEEDDEIDMEVDETATVEKVEFQTTEMGEYLGLMEEIWKVLGKSKYADHLEYYPIGNAPMMEFGKEILAEMTIMYPAMLIIMLFLLFFLFRSFSAVLWPILVVVLSSVWTVGLAGWAGITITTMLMLTVMLILAVGTADSIHILSGYLYFHSGGHDHEDAVRLAYRKSGLACMLTSLTTMAGMLALTLTRISHIQVFGFMSALGVGMAFLFTIYLLPAMLDLWAPSSRKPGPATVPGNATGSVRHRAVLATLNRFVPDASRILQRLLDKVLPIVEKNPYAVILTFAALFGFCIYGATQVKIDSNMVEQFKEGTSIRETYEIVDQYMMGTQNMEVFVDMGVENGLKDPRVLKTIENLQREFERKYGRLVVRTYSLADVVKDAYRVLNEDREAYEVVPDDARILDQTLFLFNNANPEDRRRLVSDDYRKSHVSIQLYNEGSYEYNKIFAGMKRDIHWSFAPLKDAYPEMDISVTGGLPLMMELGDYISYTQLKSLGMAIGVISVMLIFVFGSIRAGLLSIVPNLIPATLTFGLLGIVGIALDMDTLVIAPVIIGIAVDDTIHFITHYREEVLETGDVRKALRNTIKEVGQAITFTSLILGLGFSVMSFSNHMGTMNMGIFGTMAVFAAVLCDLFLLSALILVFKPRFLTKEQKLAEKAKRAEA